MSKWWQWHDPFTPGDAQPAGGPTWDDFNRLRERVDRLERAAALAPRADESTRWFHRDEYNPGPGAGTLALTTPALPWISKSVQFAERLTSLEFIRATLTEAAALGLVGALLGSGVALAFEYPWTLAPISGASAFGLAVGVLILHNRALLHVTVQQQGRGGQRNRQEADIFVHMDNGPVYPRPIARLLVEGITLVQLKEWAPRALVAPDLGVHAHSGGGKLFSQPQYSALMGQMLRFEYVKPSAGNKARQLNDRGRAVLEQVQLVKA